jgi:GT2 family glycosyltransferase
MSTTTTRSAHRVDIIIPTFNGLDLLRHCLDALRSQTFRDFAITVVDDGSSDGTAAILARDYPEVRILRHQHNSGLVAACNAGIASTDGELICLLNNDTEAEPLWLGALVAALDRAPDTGSAASKMLLFDRRDTLHSAGDGFTVSGLPVNHGVWQRDTGRYDRAHEPFGPCAGAALYRRTALRAVTVDPSGPLDPDLYMYCEDVDLAWRLQLAGYRCIFAPEARIYHHLSATGGGAFASYWVGRNLLLLLVKNYPAPLLRRYWLRITAVHAGRAWRAARAWRGAAARAAALLAQTRHARRARRGKPCPHRASPPQSRPPPQRDTLIAVLLVAGL